MADDVKDIAIYDGNKWQSLSALAAEAVEPELPISSADGTVVLDSPSANKFTIETGGNQSVIVAQNGNVGFGATPASFVKFQNTGFAATGMRSDITHNSATRYANSDGQLMVTNAAGTANIAVMSGFRIAGSTSAGATVDAYYGVYVSTVPAGAGVAAGFRTTVSGDGEDEGTSGVNGFFNVYADGSAPNYFGGEVRIRPTKNLNCSKIVGSAAPATDASIALGADLTLENKSGLIWLGSATNAPAGQTNLLVGSSDGDGKNLLIASGQPKTSAEAGSAISLATVAGNGDSARKTRLYISPEGNVGINDVSGDERLVVGGGIKAKRLKGFSANPQIVLESQQASVIASDGSGYTPTQPNSIATKGYADKKAELWTGTQAEYDQLGIYNNQTLYCITD